MLAAQLVFSLLVSVGALRALVDDDSDPPTRLLALLMFGLAIINAIAAWKAWA